jgi:hypothetical protein
LAVAGLDPRVLFGLSSQENTSSPIPAVLREADDYPFPYDSAAFLCAERVSNVRRTLGDPAVFEASLNLLLQPGKILDLKVLAADRLEALSTTPDVLSFSGVTESFEAKISGYAGGRVYYQVQYREGTGAWKALAPKSFKLPSADLDAGGEFKVILLADDHTFDDADMGVSAAYKEMKLNGDYVNEFLKTLRTNPSWEPPQSPIGKLANGLFLARALRNILYTEDADLLINLGDTNGLGASYRWAGFGLPSTNLKDADYDYVARTLWLRVRKMYSAVTPFIPMVIALGNHDGEESWSGVRAKARAWRQKYFPLPDGLTYPEGGDAHGAYYAFSLGADIKNRGGAQFIVLDVTGFTGGLEPAKPEGWTLGSEQLQWLESVLAKGEKHWSFACYHHVLGGWPAGPTELESSLAYGRGPLFQAKDYKTFTNPDAVEQVKLTDLALKYGLRAFFYGHDHIFKATYIAKGASQKDLYGVCSGSSKHIGEASWWSGANWKKYYGEASKRPPDFWGPPGYVRLTVKAASVKVEYVAAGYSPYSNLVSGQKAGDVLSTIVMTNPAPKFGVDKSAITLETTAGLGDFPPLVLRVQNGGGGALAYKIRSKTAWLVVTPESGKSWGEWRDHTLKVLGRGLGEGSYEGAVVLEAEGGGAATLEIPVKLVIGPPKIYPPVDFKATWTAERTLFASIDSILLSWKPNRLNGWIQKYRAYLVNESGGRTMIGEVPAGTLSLGFRDARRDRAYRFALTAVDERGRESEAAYATAS